MLIAIYYLVSKKNVTSISPENLPTPAFFEQENLVPSQSYSQQMQKQSEADYAFGQSEDKKYQQYPWYDQLPLQNDRYYIYFDLETKKFVGTLYTSNDQETIKSEVLNQLKNIGVDTSKYQIIWQ